MPWRPATVLAGAGGWLHREHRGEGMNRPIGLTIFFLHCSGYGGCSELCR